MLFAIYCLDKPDSEKLRAANRPAHLDYVAAAGDMVKLGGPLLSDDGAHMVGSLLIVEADSHDDVLAWAQLDPYARAGLFQSVEIRRWKWALGCIEADANV